MKKQMIAIAGAVIVVLALAGGLVWWQASQQNNPSANETLSQDNTTFAGPKDACNYLTQVIATKLLGEGSERGEGNNSVVSEDVSVSTCVYSSKRAETIAQLKDMRSATLLVRSPLSAAGATSNDEPFDTPKTGAIKVDGYGEKAFWDPELKQLNVLKGGTWLIMSLGKTDLTQSSLDDAKKLADEIVPQF